MHRFISLGAFSILNLDCLLFNPQTVSLLDLFYVIIFLVFSTHFHSPNFKVHFEIHTCSMYVYCPTFFLTENLSEWFGKMETGINLQPMSKTEIFVASNFNVGQSCIVSELSSARIHCYSNKKLIL